MGAEASRLDRDTSWIDHVERAHERSHAIARRLEEEPAPAGDLGPALRSIERAIAAMYDAIDGRDDRPTSLTRAHGRLWDAAIGAAQAGVPGAVDALRDACVELIEAERRAPVGPLPDDAPSPRATPPRIVASAGALCMHAVARSSLQPCFRAPPAPPPKVRIAAPDIPTPTTFAELAAAAAKLQKLAEERRAAITASLARPSIPTLPQRAPDREEPPPGFAMVPPPAMSEGDFLRKWARECFEEIGMLGVQRAPLPGEDWRSCSVLEDRLLASIDALASLGAPAIAHVETLAMDAPAPDPLHIFASAIIAGCTRGRDALGMAERVLHRFGAADPVVATAFTAAMKLAPHPHLPRVLRRLAGLASDPERASATALGAPPAGEPARLLSLQVLAHRGWLVAADLSPLARASDPRLRAVALEAMGPIRHPDLERTADEAIAEGGALRTAALDALLVAGSPRALRAARDACRPDDAGPALLRLAILSAETDAAWLLDRARDRPAPEAIEALGWTGSIAAVPWLLDQLGSSDENTVSYSARALDRLLGADLVEKVEILPEALEELDVHDPDPTPPRERRSLAELIDDARDTVPEGSTETHEVPSTDPEKWRAYFTEHRSRFDPSIRHRRGQPHSSSVALHELDKRSRDPDDRRLLHRELCHRTGRHVRFSPDDLVATQEKSLRAWSEIVRTTRETPGSWG